MCGATHSNGKCPVTPSAPRHPAASKPTVGRAYGFTVPAASLLPLPPEVVARQVLSSLRFKLTAQHVQIVTASGVSCADACASVPVYGIAKVPVSPFKRTIGSP